MSFISYKKDKLYINTKNKKSWSLAGDKLLTGSDDTKLNIYLPFENYEIAATIDTGIVDLRG